MLALYHPVGLRVVGCHKLQLRADKCVEITEQLRSELRSLVTDDLLGNSKS